MKLTSYFLPILKENPKDAEIVSHRYMIRAGMIHQTVSGIYSWLPLGQRVLSNLEKIIEDVQNKVGFHRIIMPTIQPASLWAESGRNEYCGKETLKITDRHDRLLFYGPTHEEVVTDIMRTHLTTYRQLPHVLYQIHWKFRDEIRPRFGVMRGREFLMKDGYSFDCDAQSARITYEKVYNSYLKIFDRMGLTVIPVRADSGDIGGDLSHEFQVMTKTGESLIFYDKAFDTLTSDQKCFATMDSLYAVSSEKHDPKCTPIPPEQIGESRGIEVGHIFYFGTKYSKSMNMTVAGSDGKLFYPEGGSYGIGVSRLVGAIIEASHDDLGIIWPKSVAPFQIGLINAKSGDNTCDQISDDLYEKLLKADYSVLYDDRLERAGVKFSAMDLIGLPVQIIVGSKTSSNGIVELKNRKTHERIELSTESIFTVLKQYFFEK